MSAIVNRNIYGELKSDAVKEEKVLNCLPTLKVEKVNCLAPVQPIVPVPSSMDLFLHKNLLLLLLQYLLSLQIYLRDLQVINQVVVLKVFLVLHLQKQQSLILKVKIVLLTFILIMKNKLVFCKTVHFPSNPPTIS